MSYSAGFACTKPTYARAEATRRRARLSLRAGKRMSDQPTPRRCPSELSLRQRRLPLPWPSNERLYGGVMRPALAGIGAHSRKAVNHGIFESLRILAISAFSVRLWRGRA